MKRISIALAMAVVFITLHSCRKIVGEGPVVTESRTAGDFTSIEYGVPAELAFIPSDHNEITIEAQQNIINVIETYVSGSELKIKVRNSVNLRPAERIRIAVKSATVTGLTINGSGDLSIIPGFTPPELTLKIIGSGSIRAENIKTGNLTAAISGSGKIEVKNGATSHQAISISGSGNVDLLGVQSSSASTETSGSGAIRIHVTDALDVRISGSGDVFYKGSPAVSTHISGSGSVVRLN